MAKEDNPSNLDIGKELGSINTKLDNALQGQQRLMYAMLGIIAATIGVKFIGTPAMLHIQTYLALLMSVFLIGMTVKTWRWLTWSRIALRIFFPIFVLFSTTVRLFLVEKQTIMPDWYPVTIDFCFIGLCILLVISAWQDKDNNKKSR